MIKIFTKESIMTKKELVAVLTAALTPLVGKPFTKEAMDNIIAEVGPKSGGFSKINVDDIIKVENGKTVQIFDTVAKVWLPATKDFFYEEKKNPNPKLNGLKNHSKAREKITKENVKHTKMAKDLVWKGSVENDVLDKNTCKNILEMVPAIDYSRTQPDGTVKSTQEIAKFEATIQELQGKVEAAIANASKQPAK
jgi:hypothetical protein